MNRKITVKRVSYSKPKDDGGCGCGMSLVGLVLWLFFFWALIFGFTIDGRHYNIDCSMENGVEVQDVTGG